MMAVLELREQVCCLYAYGTIIWIAQDNTRANYATDYLPNYTELRFELINAYQLAERRRVEMNQKGGKKGHPSFPIMD
jgi:hypothetical protein